MKYLFLVRHAKSSWSDPRLADFDRPLNKRGKRDAPFMGKRLAHASVSPELIMSSPAKRAAKTARAIAAEIGYPLAQIRYEHDLYTFDLDELRTVLYRIEESVRSLALVGHNHAVTECAEWLTGKELGNVPTSGIVAISCSEKPWCELEAGDGTLLFFDYPKKHAGRSPRE